ncbi:MAG: HAD family hydrolase [Bacteroidales bacterium]|nr:HAD family hydrolase [Bacteroidales bacterium]MDP3398223.1 HAD family hydrolase [Bacteroidales bacterium]
MPDKIRLNSNIKLIAFDADDTLWINEYHYHNAEKRFARLMEPWCDSKTANDALLKVEKDNLPLLGYGSKPFIISLVECGIALSGGSLSNDQIIELIQIGKETIGRPIELYPGTEKILATLAGHYPLVLATKGDLKEQESKVERSGLKRYFTTVEIMSEKHPDSYQKIIEEHKIKPENFLMVGNSFKSDIKPVLDIGGYAIYIPSDIIWAHEVVEETDHPNLIRAEGLDKILELFEIK